MEYLNSKPYVVEKALSNYTMLWQPRGWELMEWAHKPGSLQASLGFGLPGTMETLSPCPLLAEYTKLLQHIFASHTGPGLVPLPLTCMLSVGLALALTAIALFPILASSSLLALFYIAFLACLGCRPVVSSVAPAVAASVC